MGGMTECIQFHFNHKKKINVKENKGAGIQFNDYHI